MNNVHQISTKNSPTNTLSNHSSISYCQNYQKDPNDHRGQMKCDNFGEIF